MNDMCMRNVLILGIAVSALATAAILLSGCATSPAERSFQVLPGPTAPSESVVIEAPEEERPGYEEFITKAPVGATKTEDVKGTPVAGKTPDGLVHHSRRV